MSKALQTVMTRADTKTGTLRLASPRLRRNACGKIALVLAPSLAFRDDFDANPTIQKVYSHLSQELRPFGAFLVNTKELAAALPTGRDAPALGMRLAKLFRGERVFLAHLFGVSSSADALCLLAARVFHKMRFLITSQGLPSSSYPIRIMEGAWVRLLYRVAAQITVHSQAHQRGLLEHFPFLNPDRLTIVQNGIDYDFFSSMREAGVDIPWTARRPFLLCAARLVSCKGIDLLLFSFRDLLSLGWDLDLVLCGQDEQNGRYARLAHALGVADRVRFLGQVGDGMLKNLLDRCACFVLPSRFETFGMAAVEAMAAGRPAVVSRGAGISERIQDGREAVLVEAGSVEALTRGVLTVLKDPVFGDQLGRRGRAFAERFTWAAAAEQFVNLYERLS